MLKRVAGIFLFIGIYYYKVCYGIDDLNATATENISEIKSYDMKNLTNNTFDNDCIDEDSEDFLFEGRIISTNFDINNITEYFFNKTNLTTTYLFNKTNLANTYFYNKTNLIFNKKTTTTTTTTEDPGQRLGILAGLTNEELAEYFLHKHRVQQEKEKFQEEQLQQQLQQQLEELQKKQYFANNPPFPPNPNILPTSLRPEHTRNPSVPLSSHNYQNNYIAITPKPGSNPYPNQFNNPNFIAVSSQPQFAGYVSSTFAPGYYGSSTFAPSYYGSNPVSFVTSVPSNNPNSNQYLNNQYSFGLTTVRPPQHPPIPPSQNYPRPDIYNIPPHSNNNFQQIHNSQHQISASGYYVSVKPGKQQHSSQVNEYEDESDEDGVYVVPVLNTKKPIKKRKKTSPSPQTILQVSHIQSQVPDQFQQFPVIYKPVYLYPATKNANNEGGNLLPKEVGKISNKLDDI